MQTIFFFQIDKQLASGEYFLHEKERRLKSIQAKKVIFSDSFVLAIEVQHVCFWKCNESWSWMSKF